MKNNYKKIIRGFIFALVIPFLAFSGLASSNESSPGITPSSSQISTYVDKNIEGIVKFPITTEGENIEYVHLWFKQILGGFIFAPWGQMGIDGENYKPDDITLLAKALGFTNILSIIICLIVTYYMIIGGALNTAAEGQVLGKNWNTPWLMIRTAVGFTLITPMTVIGGMTLSLAQVGVIWLMIIGSNAASILWYYAVDELAEGTKIVSPNIDLGKHKTSEMMKMIMCSDASVRVRSPSSYSTWTGTRGNDKGIKTEIRNETTGEVKTSYGYDNTAGSANVFADAGEMMNEIMEFHFTDGSYKSISGTKADENSSPVITFGKPNLSSVVSGKEIRRIGFGYNGSCGEITFDTNIDTTRQTSSSGDGSAGTIGSQVSAMEYKNEAMRAGRRVFSEKVIEMLDHLIEANDALQKKQKYAIKYEDGKFESAFFETAKAIDTIGYKDVADLLSSDLMKKCLISGGGCGGNDIAKNIYKNFTDAQDHFNKAANIYSNELSKAVSEAIVSEKSLTDNFIGKMKSGGWPIAGVWFFEISALPGMSYNVIDQVHKTIKSEPVSLCFQSTKMLDNNCSDMEAEANSGYTVSDSLLSQSLGQLGTNEDGSIKLSREIDQAYAPCGVLGTCNSAASTSDRLSVALSSEILKFLSDTPINSNPFEKNGLADANNRLSSPFLFASELGHKMNYIAQNAVFASIAAISMRDYIEGFDSEVNRSVFDEVKSLSGTEKALHLVFGLPKAIAMNTLSFGSGIILMAAMTAFASGFVLAYAIPFMPVITWIMMMAGYMLTAVEAIAAAPLAIVLLFTPEGQGISGSRFERALQLVSMAVLRPSFMVLGMLAGLTVSFVAFTMLNVFFFTAAEYLLSGTIFDLFAIIILYVSATYQMCKLMVETMHQLPDRIGEWFAGGVSRQFGESRIADNAGQSMQMLSSKMQALPGEIVKLQQRNVEKSMQNNGNGQGFRS